MLVRIFFFPLFSEHIYMYAHAACNKANHEYEETTNESKRTMSGTFDIRQLRTALFKALTPRKSRTL